MASTHLAKNGYRANEADFEAFVTVARKRETVAVKGLCLFIGLMVTTLIVMAVSLGKGGGSVERLLGFGILFSLLGAFLPLILCNMKIKSVCHSIGMPVEKFKLIQSQIAREAVEEERKAAEALKATQPPKVEGWGTLVLGIAQLVAGLSGQFVLIGTQSSEALVVVSAGFIIVGIARIVKFSNARAKFEEKQAANPVDEKTRSPGAGSPPA